MYSLLTPRDLLIEAKNTIPSRNISNGVKNNETINDTTDHNNAMLETNKLKSLAVVALQSLLASAATTKVTR